MQGSAITWVITIITPLRSILLPRRSPRPHILARMRALVQGFCRRFPRKPQTFRGGVRPALGRLAFSRTGVSAPQTLGPVDPGLRGFLIAVPVTARQKHPTITEPGFRHERPL